jgi:hypothetical protein
MLIQVTVWLTGTSGWYRPANPPRCSAIARELVADVGSITNADTGIFTITAPFLTKASDSVTYDTSTID